MAFCVKKVDNIDETVEKIFDELMEARENAIEPHPSETVNRIFKYSSRQELPYDIINEYHSFCKMCDQHFYTCSKLNDINSFFQKHINSSYHNMCRIAYCFSPKTPIFEWEKWMYEGRCNICKMSGLQAYVVDLIVDSKKIMDLHFTRCPKKYNEGANFKHLIALKKYFCLNFFGDLFFKEEKSHVVCVLCERKFAGKKEDNFCHFASDIHFQNCLSLIWLNLQLNIKDLINGYNLERVTRWFLTLNLNCTHSIKVSHVRAECLLESNTHDLYKDIQSHSGFSPGKVEEILKCDSRDLVYCGMCLLCDQEADQFHCSSKKHVQNLKNWAFFKTKPNYSKFLKNVENRIMPYHYEIKMYKELESLILNFDELTKQISQKVLLQIDKNVFQDIISNMEPVRNIIFQKMSQKRNEMRTTSERNPYASVLIKNKLRVVEKFKRKQLGKSFYCQICDFVVNKGSVHRVDEDHINESKKWDIIKEDCSNPKYVEPLFFVKPKKFICLLCSPNAFRPGKLINHIKTTRHIELYKDYAESKRITEFKPDGSCYCAACNVNIIRGNNSWRLHFAEIKKHWYCTIKEPSEKKTGENNCALEPYENGLENENGFSELAVSVQTTEENTSLHRTSPNSQDENHTSTESTQNFEKDLLISELSNDQIVQKIADNEVSLLSDSKIYKKIQDYFDPQNKEENSEGESENDSSGSSDEEIDEDESKHTEGEEKNDHDNILNKKKENKKKSKKPKDFDKEHEILIVSGIKKKERKENVRNFCFVLKRYGEVKNMVFEGNTTFITFKQKGVPKKVVDDPPILFKNRQYEMSYLNASFASACELFMNMPKKLISVLEDPKSLVNWAFSLVSESMVLSQNIGQEQKICSTIVECVKLYYPFCRCYPFGSRLSGLTLKNSDLDVFLDIGGMYEGYNNKYATQQQAITKVALALKKNSALVEDILVVKNARVPIISFLHKQTRLRCDISFKSGLSVQNTLLMKFLVTFDWRVKYLILCLKVWADWNELHGFPYFSSYAICLLVIYYLQQPPDPVLPSIETLKNNFKGPRLTIEGWDCNFDNDVSSLPRSRKCEEPPQTLLGFFEFYAEFEYNKYVISPLTGKPLPRAAFLPQTDVKLPMAVKKQALNLPLPLNKWVNDKIPLCLMDPFDLSHLVTKCFTYQSLDRFIRFCELSKSLIKKGLND